MPDAALYEPVHDLIAANREHARALARLRRLGPEASALARSHAAFEVVAAVQAVRVAQAVADDHDD